MISAELLKAYQSAIYVVYQPSVTLRVGVSPPPTLSALLHTHQQSSWAFITPCNPFSNVLPDEANAQRFQAFLGQLTQYPYYLGEGRDPHGLWKAEKSALIVGISKERALQLAREFQQNAFLWGEHEQPASLVFTQ